jgi:hypothetical protein
MGELTMDEKLGVRLKKEIAKIWAMSFREKRWYIWEYYKLQIVGGAILLFVVGGLINTWFINPPRKEYLTLGWVDGFETEEHMTALSELLTQRLVPDTEKEYVLLTSFFTIGDPAYDQASSEKLMVMTATGTLDLLLLRKESAEAMLESGLILPIDDVLARACELSPLLADATAKRLRYSEADNRLLGIQADDCPLFTALDFLPQEEELYLCRVSTTKKIEPAAQALAMMFE